MTVGPDNNAPERPALVRQRQVPRQFNFNDEQVARRLDFNVEVAPHLGFDDNIIPPPPRLVRQHAQLIQEPVEEPVEEDMDMDIEGGSRRKKTSKRKKKNIKRKTNKRKSRGGKKKLRKSARKSRRSRK